MWVTRSAQIQRTTPVSTSATWNRVGTFGSLAPPSTWITSAIHQSSELLSPQMTVMPAFTDRNTGCDLSSERVNGTTEWSTDIPLQTNTAVLAVVSWFWQPIGAKKSDRPVQDSDQAMHPLSSGAANPTFRKDVLLTSQDGSEKNALALDMRNPHGIASLGSETSSRRRFERQPASTLQGEERTEPCPVD